jgi:hypothetical protein
LDRKGQIFDGLTIDRILLALLSSKERPVEEHFARVRESIQRSLASVQRRMTAMPTEALRWRTAATDFNVTGALISDTKMQSAMFRIADRCERMAHLVERRFLAYSRKMNLIDFDETNHINRTKISNLKDRSGGG